jgi:phosphatidylinositol alpha-1,6-mannosyltransferase
MKILYITRKYPPSIGGMQKLNYDLVTELQKTVDVELVALGKSQYHLFWFLPYAIIMGIVMNFDVIHLGDGLLAPIGWLLSKIKGKPYTVIACGLDITYENKFYRSAVIPYIKKADRIICISQNTSKLCIESGCEASKCIVIPCGIPVGENKGQDKKEAREEITRRYNINNDDLIILGVGRLVKRKGMEWFLKNVQPSLDRTTLIIAGDGPERNVIIKTAIGMEKVHILGRIDDELLQLLYWGSDAFIMPNIKVEGDVEGFGIVLLEAGYNGLYSFASNIDGIPEGVKDTMNGKLLESGNAQEWIQELSHFVENRDKLEQMGEQSRDYVIGNYSWGEITGNYKNVWKELAGKA